MSDHQNFVVYAELDAPVIAAGRLNLDSILAALIYRETQDLDRAHAEIPLARTDGIWHGSSAFFDLGLSGETGFSRRMSDSEKESAVWFRGGRRMRFSLFVDSQRGKYQNLLDSYSHLSTPAVRWFGRGDIQQVRELVSSMIYVGKKGGSGFGKVSEAGVEVVPIEHDYSMMFQGKPARPIPVEMWHATFGSTANGDCRTNMESVTPPYFETEKKLCVVPPTRYYR